MRRLVFVFLFMDVRFFRLVRPALRPRPMLAVACAGAVGFALFLILPPPLLSTVECDYVPWHVVLSPDGELLLTVEGDNDSFGIDLWRMSTGEHLQRLSTEGLLLGVAFSPDSKEVAATGIAWLQQWNIETGQQSQVSVKEEFPVHRGSGLYFAGDRLLAYDLPGTRVWDPATQGTLWEREADERESNEPHRGFPGFLVRQREDLVSVLEMPTGRVRGSFRLPAQHRFTALGITSDGARLLGYHCQYGGWLYYLTVNVPDGTIRRLPWLETASSTMAMSPDGKHLAICEEGEPERPAWIAWLLPRPALNVRCRLVDLETGRELAQLPGGYHIAFSDDGNRLAIVNDETHRIQIWDLRTDWTRIIANAGLAGVFVFLLLGWLAHSSWRQRGSALLQPPHSSPPAPCLHASAAAPVSPPR